MNPVAPPPSAPARTRGRSWIPLLIAVVVLTVVAVPVALVSWSKAAQRTRLFTELNETVGEANDLRTKLRGAYDKVRRAGRIPNAETILRAFDDQFTALFRVTYDLRKRQDGGDPPDTDEILAAKRDFDDYARRLRAQYARIHHLEQLGDVGETALQLARFYQSAVQDIRARAPYEGNERVLPQLVEAGRQLQTGMNFVFSGFSKFTDDVRGEATPTLVKTGIEQIRRVTTDIRELLERLRGTESVVMDSPATNVATLAEYIANVLRESRKREIPALPDPPAPRPTGPPRDNSPVSG